MTFRQRVGVVGGGINGLLIARILRARGHEVVVLDRGDIPNAQSASHGVHRLIHPWTPSHCRRTAARASAARSGWREILLETAIDGFVPCGVIVSNMDEAAARGSITLCPSALTVDADDRHAIGATYRGAAEQSFTIFPGYGYLLASRILEGLVRSLLRIGVAIKARCQVLAVEQGGRVIRIAAGERLRFDRIILCSGDGLAAMDGVPEATLEAISPTRMRCYVAYLQPISAASPLFGPYAWTGINGMDLWGMPSGYGISAKLGCGELTRAVPQEASLDEDQTWLRRQFLDYYGPLFGGSLDEGHLQVRWGHWTRQETTGIFQHDRLTVVAACNGAGFKFAPLIAREVADTVG